MSMKLKKTLALVLSLVTVFSAAFTSMAEIPAGGVAEPVEVAEIGDDQAVIVEDPLEEVSDIFNTATPEEVTVPENVEEVVEVVEDDPAEAGTDATVTAEANPMGGAELTGFTTWKAFGEALLAAEDGAILKLTQDLKAGDDDGNLQNPIGKTVTIDLNGFTLNRNAPDPDPEDDYWPDKPVIYMPYNYEPEPRSPSTLIIVDSSVEQTGTITGGKSMNYGGGISVNDSIQTLIIHGGNITGNVCSNHLAHKEATANPYASGIGVQHGTLIMDGGSVTGNTVICKDDKIVLGGAVVAAGDGETSIVIGGNTVIKNNVWKNQSGSTIISSDLRINTKKKYTIGNGVNGCPAPENGMEIGVFLCDTPAHKCSGAFTTNGSSDYVKYFFADYSDEQYVKFETDHLVLAEIPSGSHKINIGSFNNGSVTSDEQYAKQGSTVTLTVSPDTGYHLKADTLKVTYNDGSTQTITPTKDTTDDTKYTFTMLGYPVTVTAEFEEKPITIAEILATAQNFPTAIGDGWVNENGCRIFDAESGKERYLYAASIGSQGDIIPHVLINITELATASGNNYIWENTDGAYKVTFCMNDNKLESITIEGLTDSHDAGNGTYTHVKQKTIGDILPKDFPTAAANGWAKENGITIYKDASSSSLMTSINFGVPLNGVVKADGENYTYIDTAFHAASITITFNMVNGTLRSIGIKGADGAIDGTYAPKADPKPIPTPTHDDDDREPLFTGTWNNPVKSGAWSQDSHGIWHYTSSEMFRQTWAYIYNPYAHDGQHTSDWFWFDRQGNMLTGWQFINGKWYYLHTEKDGVLGSCLIGPAVTPDGWTVDESGAWVESIPRK